ncbi:hypothetical protein ROS60_001940 [Pluralibacter gergoviae]|nr:hypothetical protein [Pluralibacter gergoviae]ELK5591781.1 hypothetical protein [Pluralibacter gergoviae]
MPTPEFQIGNNTSNKDNINCALGKTHHLYKYTRLQRVSLLFPTQGKRNFKTRRYINMSTRLIHPSDKDRAKRIFANLK